MNIQPDKIKYQAGRCATIRRNLFILAEYDKKITTLRMLRSDLDEKKIITELKTITGLYPGGVLSVLDESIYLASIGKPLQWEKP